MRPRVILHNAVSLDGRMDWSLADLGLYYELAGRLRCDAILSGSNTILAALSAEEGATGSEAGENAADTRTGPWLVVIDGRGRIGRWDVLRAQPYWREVIVVGCAAAPRQHLVELDAAGVIHFETSGGHVDLREALEEIHRRWQVQAVRVDSGGILNGALLRAGLVDEVSLMICPCLIGGESPRSMYVAPDLASEAGAARLRLRHVEQLAGDTLWLRYDVIGS